MKKKMDVGAGIAMVLGRLSSAYAQATTFGSDQISSTIDSTINYVQYVGIGILAIHVARHLIKMGRDDHDSDRAKKGVAGGLMGIAGLMILRGIISVIRNLTGSSLTFGF